MIGMFVRQLDIPPLLREKIFAAVTFVLLPLLTGYLIPNVWIPVWKRGGIGHDAVGVVLAVAGIGNYATVYTLLTGVFVGSGVLWAFDKFKRYQAVILWSNIFVGFGVFALHWNLVLGTNLEYYGLIGLIGVCVGLHLGDFPIARFLDPRKRSTVGRPPHEFPRSVYVVIVAIAVVAGLGLFEAHFAGGWVQNPETFVRNLVTTGVVLALLGVFGRYQGTERIVCLGPAGSGKSSLMGGLYGDCETEFDDNNVADALYEDAIKKGQFPEQTKVHQFSGDDSSWTVVKFSYISGDFLFRKKQTITTVDYPGEALTGMNAESGEGTEPISTYMKKEVGTGFLDGWLKGRIWSRNLARIDGGDDHLSTEEKAKCLAHLVWAADTVAFTLPLEDFLHGPLHERPGSIPSYCTDRICKISTTEDAEAAYKAVQPTGDDPIPLESDSGGDLSEEDGTEYYPPKDVFLDLPVKKSQWLSGSDAGGEEYYVQTGRERVPPSEYVDEYDEIVDILAETYEYDFIWLVTMADLGKADFEEHFDVLTAMDINGSDGGLRSNTSSDIGLDIAEPVTISSDINHELLRSVFDDTATPNPATNELHYNLFAHWLMEQYLTQAHPSIDDTIEKTLEEYVYPVWFDIDEEDPQRFRTEFNNTLNGSQFLLERLAGNHLGHTGSRSAGTSGWAVWWRNATDDHAEQGEELLNAIYQNVNEYERDES